MPNAKDIASGSANILLVGDSGTHKTFFLGGVPGIYIFDYDKGLATLRGRDVEYDTFKDKQRGQPVNEMERKAGIYEFGGAWPAFILKLQQIGAAIQAGTGPKAIGLDSLTFLSEIAMNRVLLDTGQAQPHQGSYGAQQQYIKVVLGTLTAWPIRLVCTAHIQRDKNDLTTVIEKLPFLTGKLAGMISAYFDEVYFCESSVDATGVQKFIVKTKATPEMRQAKSRWGVPNDTETSYAAVEKFYNAPPILEGAPAPGLRKL